MKIYLIRHAVAAPRNPAKYPDDDRRPLTSKGGASFSRAVRGLRRSGARFGEILTSPALRASQSAEILAGGFPRHANAVSRLPELHHAYPPAKALKRLAKLKLPESVALIGHEPWLGEFLSLLTTGKSVGRFRLDKGGCCLVEAASLRKGRGALIWLLTQDHLQALGGEWYADKSG